MDAATDAEIARILAEEQGGIYGYEYGFLDDNNDTDDDPDYGAKRKKKPRKPKPRVVEEHISSKEIKADDLVAHQLVSSMAGPLKQESTAQVQQGQHAQEQQQQQQALNQQDLGYSATGRRKRKDTGAPRTASRAWSDEEEALFKDALCLHGRDWKRCAEHIGTRDARAVASHTQKFLIKALLRGEELPEAMARSGRGYTLSGKPLDPNSAAARAYGLRPKEYLKIVESGILEVGVHVTTFEVDGLDGAQSSGKSAAPEKPKEQSGSLKLKLQKKKVVEEVPSSPPEPTEYSKNRPRRQLIGSRATMGDTTESTDLTTLQEFIGPVGSEGGRCQPFEVTLSSDAVLVMDFHAHLSTWEVIGLLGGQFDEGTKQLTIKSAYPCRRAAGSDSGTSVELDPASQVEVTAEMSKEGLKPVGWYHSHPVFEARPSAKDNENQRNYQALCRDGKHEPWVGIIIGPYDQQLATPASQVQAWVVKTISQHGMTDVVPFNIRARRIPEKTIPTPSLESKLETALEQLKEDPGRVNMKEIWRPYKFLVQGQPDGPPLTREEKLRAALNVHLKLDEQTGEVEEFHRRIESMFQKHWC